VPTEIELLREAGLPEAFIPLLDRWDGAAELVASLTTHYHPADVATNEGGARAWELCGLYFKNSGRFHDALAIFYGLYEHKLSYQISTGTWINKGTPLIWISDCHRELRHPLHAKRYLMLTLCEDAISQQGYSSSNSSIYPRMVVWYGVPQNEVVRYSNMAWEKYQGNPNRALYPEWILQEFDQEWMTDLPSQSEVLDYRITSQYALSLLSELGQGDGKALERLAHYILQSMPGCRAYMRASAKSTDLDVVCTLEGPSVDFRSELGRYFLCECKDWAKPVNFTSFAKFSSILQSSKCKFGIIFSKMGITGKDKDTAAEHDQMKVFQNSGTAVIIITESDLQRVATGANLITLLRSKYEEVRLDLRKKRVKNLKRTRTP
jgi:hypothetical protein